ncbi:hypothetical protein HMPREF0658_1080 [Hoylesella marshii DSM 16973 = JCM 13450]|uniref:Uncharacterized protein n=1 Tax=Hoylesella marshii DSM 16973 = JCM 13450 TaxID=862515 RepID=E0NSC9_9BACT|nr:hypothetical protein HMPREF0658_1080 [Hoylesella marshii DSM 16973 = JCM 13450]
MPFNPKSVFISVSQTKQFIREFGIRESHLIAPKGRKITAE